MGTPIPSPLPISCTDCNQPMRVEFQMDQWSWCHTVIIAAECRCGRVIGTIARRAVLELDDGRSLTRADIKVQADADLGKEAAESIAQYREAIADMERVIAAATWVRGGR